DEAVRVEGEEDVAQRPLGDVERTRELTDAHRAAALGDGAQDARGFVDRRHRPKASRTPCHTRTADDTTMTRRRAAETTRRAPFGGSHPRARSSAHRGGRR